MQHLYTQALSESSSTSSNEAARCLFCIAEEKLLEYHYLSIPTRWLQTYADAALLCVIPLLRTFMTEVDVLQIIKKLDMSFIVVGRPDEEQADFTLEVIKALQSLVPGSLAFEKLPTASTALEIPRGRRIKEFNVKEAPSFDAYLSTAYAEPFIVRGGSSHWPAISTWCDLNYLSQKAGPGRIVPIEIGDSYTSDEWTQKILSFDSFLSSLTDAGGKQVMYLAQYDLFAQIPALRSDVVPPDYVFSAPSAPEHYEQYTGPANGYIQNLWLGPAKTHSPAHTDPYYNAYSSSPFSFPQAKLMIRVSSTSVWTQKSLGCTAFDLVDD